MKEYIRAAPAFAGISADAVEMLAEGGTWVSLQPGETLFSQGDPSDALYLSVEGRLKVLIPGAAGAEIVIAELGPAEIVGENPFALFGGVGAVWLKTKTSAGLARLTATHQTLGSKTVEIAVKPFRPSFPQV